jgi:hypothetical protein
MMADTELWNAINVIARNFGLISERQWLIVVDDEAPDVPPCLEPGRCDRRGVVLLCSRPKGHESPCSWAAAFVGIGESVAESARRAGFAPGPESVTVSYDVAAAGRPSLTDEYAEMRREDERRAAEKHIASPDPITPRT